MKGVGEEGMARGDKRNWVNVVDKWEENSSPMFIVFLAGVSVVMPFIDAVVSVCEGGRAVKFFLINRKWPGASDLTGDKWTHV